MLKWRLDRGVAQQMEVLKKGFSEVMPPHLLVDFDAHELEFITAGTVEIDIEDWRNHTEYRNGEKVTVSVLCNTLCKFCHSHAYKSCVLYSALIVLFLYMYIIICHIQHP